MYSPSRLSCPSNVSISFLLFYTLYTTTDDILSHSQASRNLFSATVKNYSKRMRPTRTSTRFLIDTTFILAVQKKDRGAQQRMGYHILAVSSEYKVVQRLSDKQLSTAPPKKGKGIRRINSPSQHRLTSGRFSQDMRKQRRRQR